VRNGNRVIDERSLAGFVPPFARSKAGQQMRPWTEGEDAALRECAGLTFQQKAARLGRSLGSVSNRWYRTRSVA